MDSSNVTKIVFLTLLIILKLLEKFIKNMVKKLQDLLFLYYLIRKLILLSTIKVLKLLLCLIPYLINMLKKIRN